MSYLVDLLTDELSDLPRGERQAYYGIEVVRAERSDPDGWEYSIGLGHDFTAHEAAKYIERELSCD